MDDKDMLVGLFAFGLLALLVIGLPYGTYKYGRYAERRLLTEAYMKTMAQDYSVGEEAGLKEGYKIGFKDGVGAGKLEILKEEDENARY